jgi:hypothetical protein
MRASTTLALCSALLLTAQLATGLPAGQVVDENDGRPEALKGSQLLKVSYAKLPYLKKAGDSPSRSPCPFLNSAANHGILPYSGKGIKLAWITALIKKVGLSEQAAAPIVSAMDKVIAKAKETNPDHAGDSIDLGDLNAHGVIEHNGSLTRMDIIDPKTNVDEAARPDTKLIGSMLIAPNTMSGRKTEGLPELTHASVGYWRQKRVEQERQRKLPDGSDYHPNYYFSRANILGSGECALLLHVLGNGGKISGAHANSFLAKEMFPDGWEAHPVSLPSFVAAIGRCAADSALVPQDVLSWFETYWNAPPTKPTGVDTQTWSQKMSSAWTWAFGGKDDKPKPQ